MVRERTGGTLWLVFVQADPPAELLDAYGMVTDEGNAAVGEALAAFLAEPSVRAMTPSATPQQRLDAFQNGSVLSAQDVP